MPNSFWSYQETLDLANLRATNPPLGLITVAAMLPSDWELRLSDRNVRLENDVDWQSFLENDETKKILSKILFFNGINYSSQITVKTLLQHKSGLRDYFADDERFFENIKKYLI